MNCACVTGADEVLVANVKSERVDLHPFHPTAKLKQPVTFWNGEDPDHSALMGKEKCVELRCH